MEHFFQQLIVSFIYSLFLFYKELGEAILLLAQLPLNDVKFHDGPFVSFLKLISNKHRFYQRILCEQL